MNRIIKARVSGEYIKLSSQTAGAAGSHNAVELDIIFDDIWNGTSRKVYFISADGEKTACMTLTTDLLKEGETDEYLVPIPSEGLSCPGSMTLTVKGFHISADGTTSDRVVMSASVKMSVLKSGLPPLNYEPADLTPTQAEQLQGEIDDIKGDIVNAQLSATAAAGSAAAAETAKVAAQTAQTGAESAKAKAEAANTAAQAAKTEAEAARAGAEGAEAKAALSAEAALGYKNAAEIAKTAAETARAGAEKAEAGALSSKEAAAGSEANALDYKNAAEIAKTAAEAAKTQAQTAQAGAEAARTGAAAARAAAETAQSGAETAEANAAESEASALVYKNTAVAAAETATEKAAAASLSEANALASKNAAMTARTAAETARTGAESAEAASNAAKEAAEASAKSAAEDANNALLSAGEAEASAAEALNSANTSTAAKNAAEAAKTAAETAKTAAQTAKNAAEAANTAAQTAKTDAQSAKTAAQTAKEAAEAANSLAQTAKAAAEGAATAAQAAKEAAEKAQAGAESSEENAEAWACGTIGGAAVPSTHPAYHNNSKWYKDQAAEIVGGNYATKTEAQGYVDAHDGSMGAHGALFGGKLDKTGDGSNVTAAFTQAGARTNLATGEKLSVSLGKIKKWFADLGTAAFAAATDFAAAVHTHTKSQITDFPSTMKNPAALSFGANTYDGSAAKEVTAADLGALTQHQDISGKVDKITGKGLSTNDYTTAEKDKLAGIEPGAEANIQSDWNAADGDAFIKNKPTAMKNPAALSFGSKTYDGSAAKEVTAEDLGALTAHQNISGKADKKPPTAANNVALLDSTGNLADSGKQLTPAGIGAAAASHKHPQSDITSLATDLGNKQSKITASGVLKGNGSGAVSAAARGTDYSLVTAPITVSVPYTGWVQNSSTSAYEQSVNVSGLLATDDKRTRVEVLGSTDVGAQALIDAAAGCLSYVACQTNGKLYLRCDKSAPETTFSVAVVIVR